MAGNPSRSKLYFKLSEMSGSSSMIRIGRVIYSTSFVVLKKIFHLSFAHSLRSATHQYRIENRIRGFFSFTPGFSQVTECAIKLGNRLNGFRFLGNIATWLKPGVNQTAMLITGSQLTTRLQFKLEFTNDRWKISSVSLFEVLDESSLGHVNSQLA